MLKDLEFSELDDKGYKMVSGNVGITCTSMPGMWNTSTTLLEDVCLAYNYQRQLSEFEESSRKLYDLLFAMSSVMGIWDEDEDEDL
jgi:hypothetical protein